MYRIEPSSRPWWKVLKPEEEGHIWSALQVRLTLPPI
eukprot:COSAG06_NODE_12292_length_1398_cov_366.963818_2_plen_36_part_01